jgi:hypothetical protein
MPKTITKPSGTDWERVKREAAQDAPIPHTAADGPYNPNDADVLDAFKATGPGWQTRINAALRDAVAHGVTKV